MTLLGYPEEAIHNWAGRHLIESRIGPVPLGWESVTVHKGMGGKGNRNIGLAKGGKRSQHHSTIALRHSKGYGKGIKGDKGGKQTVQQPTTAPSSMTGVSPEDS